MVMEQPPDRRRASTCIGCGGAIHDQYILRVSPDLEWHAACLRCAECNQFLDDNCTCFVRDGKTYCKRDYMRLFGAKCSKCAKLFSSTDMVMRARDKIFHIDCFRCCVCAKHLVPGDEFALRSEALYCKDDYGCKEDAVNAASKLGAKSPGDSGEENVQPKTEKEQKKREGKTTRVRTVLNEKQLHTLRTCYNANPRPDALMKEQMVEMTGLSPRVIRVWFQNKRCKDKKRQIYLRQMQEANKDGRRLNGLLPIQGIHMVASSPVRQCDAASMDVAGAGVDITSFQPPWKTLHEYALQGDIDPGTPQYQSLLSQMHGFGGEPLPLPPPPPAAEGCVPRHDAPLQPPQPIKYEADVGSDSYVSYLESDDSLHTSSP